jgi:hypothetical protein
MSYGQRCSHLPLLFRGLILRLRSNQPLGSNGLTATGAAEHGAERFRWPGLNPALLD